MLWLAETIYPANEQVNAAIVESGGEASVLSISVWTQYILDTCDSVETAIAAMCHRYMRMTTLPTNGDPVVCHLVVSDAEGYTALFEYDKRLSKYTFRLSQVKAERKTRPISVIS